MKSAAKIIVNGTVQGVFFRNFCKENADALDLKGHVRNLESGEIEIVVEGDKDNIGQLIKKLNEGPKHAQIRNVSVKEKSWSGDLKEFKVLRF